MDETSDVIYTQVSQHWYNTVLLRSDGAAVVYGFKEEIGNIPLLQEGVVFVPIPLTLHEHVVQLFVDGSTGAHKACCRSLSGDELASWVVTEKAIGVQRSVTQVLRMFDRKLQIVLPDGSLASQCLTWEDLLGQQPEANASTDRRRPSKRRRSMER